MKATFLILMLLFQYFSLIAQIYSSDSSAQIIGYWNQDEKQTFDISYEKYKVKKGDTTSRMVIKYEVDITVKDSTEDSYLIEWYYKNYDVSTGNELVKKFYST